jgi:serine/threonine protein kinase
MSQTPSTKRRPRLAAASLTKSSAEAPAKTASPSSGAVSPSFSQSPTSTSLLYSLLLRNGGSRGGHGRESLERASHSRSASYGHTPRTSVELDSTTGDLLRAEVSKLMPYRGVLLAEDTACDTGILSSSSTPPPTASSSGRDATPSTRKKDNAPPAKPYRAVLVRLAVFDDATKGAPPPSASVSTAASPLSSSPAKDATGQEQRKKLPASTIVVKKRPPRRIAAAEAAATAAAPPTASPDPSPEAPVSKSSFKPFAADEKSGAEERPRFTAVDSSQVAAAFAQLKVLLTDFAAAIEQCRLAMEEQRSGSLAGWEMRRPEDDVQEASTSGDAAAAYPRLRRKSPGPRRRVHNTVLVADVPPRCHSTQLISGMVSPNSTADMVRADHVGGFSNNITNGSAPLTGRSISAESPREAGEQSVCGGTEAVDLPRGVVAIAYTIADHLYALFHPTLTSAELEEEAASLECQARGDGAAHLATSSQSRRTRLATLRDESRSVSPASRTSPSASPLLCPRAVRKAPARETEISLELSELKAATHEYIWDRIKTLVSSISLNLPPDGNNAAGARHKYGDSRVADGTEEERKAQAYVQLPFLIWLYAASGLATDVVRGCEELKTKTGTAPPLSSFPFATSSAGASPHPPVTLADLLPIVDTLARQMQRRQYERVQPTTETLLTVNTFLALTGVKMTDKAMMERLFPLQSGTTVHDVLAFSTLHSTASLLAHEGGDFVDLSAATTATCNQLATMASATTASETPLSIEEPVLAPSGGVANSTSFPVRGGSGARVSGSPLRRLRCGALRASTASPPSWVETQLGHDQVADVSTVELYLNWLRRKEKPAAQDDDRVSEDTAQVKEKESVTQAGSGRQARTMRDTAGAAHSDGGERSGADLTRGRSSSSSSRSRSADSCVTQQQQTQAFHLSSVLPSADLSPCLARVERELHQARGALQFARRLGTLYATQDMNTLLPLLPTLTEEARNTLSASMELGNAALPGSFDSCVTPSSPNPFFANSSLSAPAGARVLPPPMSTPNAANATALPGRLPPLIVAPLPPSERHSGIFTMLTSRRAANSASTSTLFPSVLPPNMDRGSLMAHLNNCATAMLSLNDQFFVNSARALEVAFSLCMVLLSHVMGEAVLKGERAAPDPSAAKPASKVGDGTPSVVVIKNPPFSKSSTAAAGPKTPDGPTVTIKAVGESLTTAPKPQPLSIDLAQVFGFGKGHQRYLHFSTYVRGTLISVALSALQQKDVVVVQELLQYIALDTAISHHHAQVRENQQGSLLTSTLTKIGGGSQRGEPGTATTSTTIHKNCKATRVSPERQQGRWMASLQNSSDSFVNVWFSSFAHLVDTTKHLLKGDHNTPSSLKDAVWHLAGLAQYFLLMRARGYDVYGGRSHLSAASQPMRVDDLSVVLSSHTVSRGGVLRGGTGGVGNVGTCAAEADLVASPALQHYITTHLVEPAEKVLGVLVSFMESIGEALTADMDSGAAMERQLRESMMFADMMSEDENAAAGQPAEASEYGGSARDSLSQMSSEAGGGGGNCCGATGDGVGGAGGGGGGYSSAANRSDAQEAQTCWMELAVHYFLEIVDVLLDVSLYLPEKPLVVYQLTVGASRVPSFTSDLLDVMMTVGVAGPRSPPVSTPDYFPGGSTALEEESCGDTPLERFQTFVSRYTFLVMQSAVTRFSVEGINMPAWMATVHGSPTNASATTGMVEETSPAPPRTLFTSLLASVAASLTPVGLEDIALSSARPGTVQQQPPLTSRSSGAPASARAEASPSLVSVPSATARSTMWWPKARFQRYSHLVRIIEHAQLLCLFLNTSTGDEATPSAPILAVTDRTNTNAAGRDTSPSLRVSAVTALLNTSTGPCAQLLSVPYACPPLTVEANSFAANSMPNTSRDRQLFHSPMEQPQGRYYGAGSGGGSAPHRLVLSDRVLREVCGGLWIRVEVLQLLRFAAAPLDTDSFASFTKMASEVASQARERPMQSHYMAIASMKANMESVLPKTYASTYVRLLFLRYVQAFYADMQALGATGRAPGGSSLNAAGTSLSAVPDHAPTDRTDNTAGINASNAISSSYHPPGALHADPNNGDATTRSAVSPRASAFLTSPLQDLSRRLWTQYCYQLLWALRDLCWNSTEAHETANNLSIASVYGRLLQMIGGQPHQGDYEDELEEGSKGDGDELQGGPELDLGEADLATIITFDRSLAPYCTTKDGKPEGFVDFESVSSDSEAVRVSPPPALPLREAIVVPSDASRSGGDGRTAAPSVSSKSTTLPPPQPSEGTSTGSGTALVSVNVSELTTLQSLELKLRRERGFAVYGDDGDNVNTHDESAPVAVAAAAAVAPPPPPLVLPQLTLTGLKPPLYFASSGDTAAAQEDDYFKEQSKQRQMAEELEERQRNVASVSVMDANSYISEGEEEDDDFVEEEMEDSKLSFGLPYASGTSGRHRAHTSTLPQPPASGSCLQAAGGGDNNGAAPQPPALTIPKLSLGSLGPPLYFTSAGDTGVFAEVTAAGASSPLLAKHTDPHDRPALGVGGKSEEKPPTEKAKTAAPSSPPPPQQPVLPSAITKTVGGLPLPKLAFGALGPPMYFTSSGDTGAFMEAQQQQQQLLQNNINSNPKRIFAEKTPTPGFSRTDSQMSTNTARFHSDAKAHGAPPAASSPEGGNTPATALAGRYHDFSLSGTSEASSWSSSFGARAATHKDADDHGGDGDGPDSRGAVDSGAGSNSSFVSSAAPEGEAAPRVGRRKKRTPGSPRLPVAPVVPPVVTMELILLLCSIILQRDSGMIQYGYTVSSLTQKRVLPGVSAPQRRWLNSGNKMTGSSVSGAFLSKSVFGGGTDAAGQGDHWRYTPQHSPSSFHVIQALHNYLKDPRNTFVVDLLEEWLLDEYAAMERTRLEQFEVECGPQRREQRLRTLSLSTSTLRSNLNSTATTEASGRYNSAISMGRFVLLRLLLPRAITQLVIPPNERRIGAGGYGSVTSGTVHVLSSGAAVLPPSWGRRGCRWRPASDSKASGGPARSASGSHSFGAKSPISPERAMCSALDGLRTPWRVAVFRAAQAACHCDVAIKHLPLSAQGSESGNLPVCHAEVLAMYRLRGHPHIVPLLSFDNTKDEYILVMPNYTLGSFRVWRQKHYQLGYAVLSLPSEANEQRNGALAPQRPLSSPVLKSSLFATCARSLLQVLEAVVCMHERHIRHGDIKCDNLLIDKADASKEGKLDPPFMPLSVRLCDFGSCDTCDDDDIRSLRNDIMAGAARFMAGRWGVGRGTEAIQPPEVISAKRRYIFFHRIMTTPATASTASHYPAPPERTDRVPHGSSLASVPVDQLGRTRTADSVEGEERAVTERLRRAELSVDIWACGCLLYEMLTGRMLFGEARLGRLLVLATADERTSATVPRHAAAAATAAKTAAVAPTEEATAAHPPASTTSRLALDEWERQDLENAVGTQVVDFMSSLLNLDPLRRPSAAEALYAWKEILMSMGLEV